MPTDTPFADLATRIAELERALSAAALPSAEAQAYAERLAAIRNAYLDAQLNDLSEQLKGDLAYAGTLFDQSPQGSGAIGDLYGEALQQRLNNEAQALDDALGVQRDLNKQQQDGLQGLLDESVSSLSPQRQRPAQPPHSGPFRAGTKELPRGMDVWLR